MNPGKLKVLLFNILEGGHEHQMGDRRSGILSFLQNEKPDVLTVCEGNKFDAHGWKDLFELERLLDMRCFAGRAGSGFHVLLFINTKRLRPISYSRQVEPRFTHALVGLTVETETGARIRLLATHLSASSGEARLIETQQLLAYFKPGEPAMIMGDLNCDTLPDPDGKRWSRIKTHYRTWLGGEGIDPRPVRRMLTTGFQDLGARLGAPVPTFPTPGSGYPDPEPLRLDYILANEPLASALESYEVVKNADTDRLSDHYPVRAIFG